MIITEVFSQSPEIDTGRGVMGIWIVSIVMGVFTFLSLYMALLAVRMGEDSAYFFAAAGLFCGIFFVLPIITFLSGKNKLMNKVDEKISGGPRPVSFVPHWFMLAAILIAGIGILAAILIPKFFR